MAVSAFAGSGTCVYRGGGFRHTAVDARSAYRLDYTPTFAADDLGVRPAQGTTD